MRPGRQRSQGPGHTRRLRCGLIRASAGPVAGQLEEHVVERRLPDGQRFRDDSVRVEETDDLADGGALVGHLHGQRAAVEQTGRAEPLQARGAALGGGGITDADLHDNGAQACLELAWGALGDDLAAVDRPTCTNFMNELSQPVLARLRDCETAYALVSRAPRTKIVAYQASKGWTLPWYSSYGSDFNFDFQVTLDESVGQVHYNYRPEPGLLDGRQSTEMPGASCFLRDRGEIFHTYSAYARGLDHIDLPYAFLDLTALGRQEAWEEPKGRAPTIR